MNDVLTRELLAQAVIVLAICVGGWMMLVQPAAEELAKIENEIAQSRAAATGLNQDAIEKLANRMNDLRQRVQTVQRRSRLDADSSRLYGLIMKLARENGVIVRRLQPGSGREMSADGLIGRTNIEVAAEGGYEQVAAFLDAVGNLDGFIRPVSLTLTPRHGDAGGQLASAVFSCQALSFTLSEALSELGDAANGHR